MTLHELLSTHSQKPLRRHFPRQPDILSHPQEIAALGPKQIACIDGVGAATMKEIAQVLITTSWTFVYENSALWVGEGQ